MECRLTLNSRELPASAAKMLGLKAVPPGSTLSFFLSVCPAEKDGYRLDSEVSPGSLGKYN